MRRVPRLHYARRRRRVISSFRCNLIKISAYRSYLPRTVYISFFIFIVSYLRIYLDLLIAMTHPRHFADLLQPALANKRFLP